MEGVVPDVAAWSAIVEVIATRCTIGQGKQDDPVRTVFHLFTKDGAVLAVYDPIDGSSVSSVISSLLADHA